jgi:hypothetical protein
MTTINHVNVMALFSFQPHLRHYFMTYSSVPQVSLDIHSVHERVLKHFPAQKIQGLSRKYQK